MIETKEENAKKEIPNKNNLKSQEKEQKENKKNNMFEKKIIVYIIVAAIILLYVAQLQMHDIIDRGVINKSQESQIIYPDKNKNNNNNNNNGNKDDNGNNNNNPDNPEKPEQPDTPEKPDNPDEPDTPIIDNDARIRIMQGTTEWKDLKELNVFDTSKSTHVTSGKIAPGVQGVYVYTVENDRSTKMKYNFNFEEENKYDINMVFKLKRNGEYIAGAPNKWTKIAELSQEDLQIESGTTDIYELEWRWEDSENDTEIGKTDGAYYKIKISSTATEL